MVLESAATWGVQHVYSQQHSHHCDCGVIWIVFFTWRRFNACKGIYITFVVCGLAVSVIHASKYNNTGCKCKWIFEAPGGASLGRGKNSFAEPTSRTRTSCNLNQEWFIFLGVKEEVTLSDINLDVPQGSLVAIVGSTGEGKTSLVSAMLGEFPPVGDTSVVIRGTVAWIFNATVRQNILFGSAFDPTRYSKAIDVTALRHDLDLLPGSDLTEIGERGVNISGGQKQQVSMARAVYSNSDVYIFYDPLSALDAHVARQVFEKCILVHEGMVKELRGKTRVLVTNQLHILSQVDRVILVHEGMVKEEGTSEDLSNNGQLFQKLMENAGKLEEYVEENEDGLKTDNKVSKPTVNGEIDEIPKD